MQTHKLIGILTIILITTMACKITGASTDVPSAATETPAVDYKATESALQTMVAEQAAALEQATALAAEVNATATAAVLLAQSAPTATTDRPTQPPVVEPTFTPAVDSAATQQAQAFQATLQELVDDGVISSTEGDYYLLDDFNESEAKMGYYSGMFTDYSAENFILSTDAAWESASDTANWPDSGCAILFSYNDENELHMAFLGLDGYGWLNRKSKGDWKVLAGEYYGKLDVPDGEAKITLVVNDKRISLYVNGERVVSAYDSSLNEGDIAQTVLSGTNKGFGTKCTMTNTDLFIFK